MHKEEKCESGGKGKFYLGGGIREGDVSREGTPERRRDSFLLFRSSEK